MAIDIFNPRTEFTASLIFLIISGLLGYLAHETTTKIVEWILGYLAFSFLLGATVCAIHAYTDLKDSGKTDSTQ